MRLADSDVQIRVGRRDRPLAVKERQEQKPELLIVSMTRT